MHGCAAKKSGAPRGNKNAVRHGAWAAWQRLLERAGGLGTFDFSKLDLEPAVPPEDTQMPGPETRPHPQQSLNEANLESSQANFSVLDLEPLSPTEEDNLRQLLGQFEPDLAQNLSQALGLPQSDRE
jgi:hypothetical protein